MFLYVVPNRNKEKGSGTPCKERFIIATSQHSQTRTQRLATSGSLDNENNQNGIAKTTQEQSKIPQTKQKTNQNKTTRKTQTYADIHTHTQTNKQNSESTKKTKKKQLQTSASKGLRPNYHYLMAMAPMSDIRREEGRSQPYECKRVLKNKWLWVKNTGYLKTLLVKGKIDPSRIHLWSPRVFFLTHSKIWL